MNVIERLKFNIDLIKKENPKKSNLNILCDMSYNVLVHGLTFAEYRKANYINLTKEEKKKCLTRREYKKVINYLDDQRYTNIFLDKILFNKIFRNYIGREYIDIRNTSYKDFEKFVKDKEIFFVKKHNSFGGDGVEKVINKDLDYKELYKKLFETKQYLVEEAIIQHAYLDKINPRAVNNVRIVTLVKDGEVSIVGSVLRISNGEEDALSHGEIIQTLDESGNAISNAYNDYFKKFSKHPTTKFDFKTTKIPYMKEAIKLVKSAALEVPEVRYIGWDVAISEKGPLLIEGNYFPSTGLHQYYSINKDFYFKKTLQDVLKDEYNNIK